MFKKGNIMIKRNIHGSISILEWPTIIFLDLIGTFEADPPLYSYYHIATDMILDNQQKDHATSIMTKD